MMTVKNCLACRRMRDNTLNGGPAPLLEDGDPGALPPLAGMGEEEWVESRER
jgi:hypothetical protein